MTKYRLARKTITRSIGEVVKELRLEKGMSICNLARKAKIPYQSIQNIENGNKPNFDYVVSIAKALDEPLEKFIIERRNINEESKTTIQSDFMLPG